MIGLPLLPLSELCTRYPLGGATTALATCSLFLTTVDLIYHKHLILFWLEWLLNLLHATHQSQLSLVALRLALLGLLSLIGSNVATSAPIRSQH